MSEESKNEKTSAPGSVSSLCLIERDQNKDVFVSWVFPALSKPERTAVVARSLLRNASAPDTDFWYAQFANKWQYFAHSSNAGQSSGSPSRCTRFVWVLTSPRFNPDKFASILKALTSNYVRTQSPVDAAQCVVDLWSGCPSVSIPAGSGQDGSVELSQHDERRARLFPIKHMITRFKHRAILVWMAMLLKRRICVVSSKLSKVQAVARSCVNMGAWHRQDLSVLFPLLHTGSSVEVGDLGSRTHYIAGCLAKKSAKKSNNNNSSSVPTDLYDVLLDAKNARIVLSSASKHSEMEISPYIKKVALRMMQAAEDGTEQGLLKFWVIETKKVISLVRRMVKSHEISSAGDVLKVLQDDAMTLKEDEVTPTFAQFLFGVSRAIK